MVLFWIVKYNIKNKVFNIDNNYRLKNSEFVYYNRRKKNNKYIYRSLT